MTYDKDNLLLEMAVEDLTMGDDGMDILSRMSRIRQRLSAITGVSTGRIMSDYASAKEISKMINSKPVLHILLETDFSDLERRVILGSGGSSDGFIGFSPIRTRSLFASALVEDQWKPVSKSKAPKHWEHLNKKHKKGRW